jgi:hypothetical protein
VLVDTQGFVLHAIVTAADIQDRDGGAVLLATRFDMFPFHVSVNRAKALSTRGLTQYSAKTSDLLRLGVGGAAMGRDEKTRWMSASPFSERRSLNSAGSMRAGAVSPEKLENASLLIHRRALQP